MPVSKHIESTNHPNNVPNSKRSKGVQAESEACAYLESLGFEIIERNFFARYGEIDIIAKDGSVLVFVEVKGRQDSRRGFCGLRGPSPVPCRR